MLVSFFWLKIYVEGKEENVSVTTHASFDSAHFLSGYEGKCSNIHGHRWKLEVTVQSETLEQTGQIRGMVVDFGQLKDDIKKISRWVWS